jgi:localization factor PodJL
MTSGVPWQVEGIRPQARDTAQEAARRSGMSVGEWLDSVISDSAKSDADDPASQLAGLLHDHDRDAADINARAFPARRSTTDFDHGRHAPAEDLTEVKDRLDDVGRRLDQLSRLNTNQAYLRPDLRPDEPPRELADVISNLDRRLDRLIASGRTAGEAVSAADREPPAPAADPSSPLAQALIEIAARQRTLDADAGPSAARSARADAPPRTPTQGLSNLEEQLRQVTTRIETLRPCGVNEAVETLRDDLAEIGLMLKDAMPRKSIEALEVEVRGLSARLQVNRPTDETDAAIAGVERGLAEVRDALRALTPAENLVGIDETVRELSHKIDRIASNSQDPAAMEQLESAIVGLRGIATHVASDGTLAKLSDEVRGLATKVDQIARSANSGADLLSTLEQRISSMADMLASHHPVTSVPNDLDAVVKGLADRLEGLGFNRSDQAAVGQLEDRISSLVEKLDTSNAQLNHLETIEGALTDLLDHLERQRQPDVASAPAPPSPEVSSLRQDVQQTQNSLESVQGALEHLVDRLASIESDIRSASPIGATDPQGLGPAVAAAAMPAASPTAPARAAAPLSAALPTAPAARPERPAQAPHEHRPIDPNLPPDHPLEPGAMRGRAGNSPVDRIAASEAALGPVKPPVIPDPGSKSNFIAAARRAAQAANSESAGRNDKVAPAPTTPGQAISGQAAAKAATRWGNRVRSALVVVSVVLIVLGSLHLVVSLFGSSDESVDGSRSQETVSAPKGDEQTVAPTAPKTDRSTTEDLIVPAPKGPNGSGPKVPAPAPGRQSMIAPTGGDTAVSIPTGVLPQEVARQPSADLPIPGIPAVVAQKDVTGAISSPFAAVPAMPAAQPATTSVANGARATVDRLPATITGPLRAAAAKGDPAAAFEIAQRYAEGRNGAPLNLAEAADWFDRAAKQGLPIAQFRLGGFYEKGFGVKKDLEAARRLYLAAADAGNAKAMHNLAVLYAEGIDGKPDYLNAAKWFRKGADYGLSDSQYNLGILFGRGIGMETNLPEAYKWFTLAARDGDKESANKRDDVGGRMDPKSLAAAKLAVQAWTALEQPEAATQAAAPAGGWDNAAAAPPSDPKPRKPAPKAEHASLPPAR